MDQNQKHTKECPLPKANFVSQLFFWWLNPIFKIGYKRSLEVNDMYNVTEEDSTKYLQAKLQREWEKELKNRKDGKTPSLRNAIIRTFRARFLMYGIVVFLEEATKVFQPILLGGLIRYFAPGSQMPTWEAYSYAAGVAGCAMLLALSHHPYFFAVQRIGMWMRVSACALIYNKALKLSSKSLGQTTAGHIVNLMSNDVVRFDFAPMFLHYLWVGPLQALFVLGYLWYMLGPTSIASFVILISLIPVQGSMGRLFTKLRRKVAVQTDERVRLMNEILSAMRVVKMYCWEKMFGELVKEVRTAEMKKVASANYARGSILSTFFAFRKCVVYFLFLAFFFTGEILTQEKVFVVLAIYNWHAVVMMRFFPEQIMIVSESRTSIDRLEFQLVSERREVYRIVRAAYARAAILAPFFASAKVIVFATVVAYVVVNNTFTAEMAFLVIAMYNGTRLTMNLFIPFAITFTAESRVTIQRIQKFLLLEELEETSSFVRPSIRPAADDCKITALSISATWDKAQTTSATLNNISFDVRPGELLAVIGPVGAGKSSLLMALLGELPLTGGSIKLSGKVAYASQEPWVFSASVRQNILFGAKYDQQKYQLAVTASALNKDLELMPDGDLTLVGERGVSLSGGQKARISLARAIYFQADIYLLDDPLSAVDTAVGRHLFDKCICGVLKNKPRVLVTHQLQYLKNADKILILKEGNVLGMGTFDELAASGVDFSSLLKHKEDDTQEIITPDLIDSPEINNIHDVTKSPYPNRKQLSPQEIKLLLKISPAVYSEVEAGSFTGTGSNPLLDDDNAEESGQRSHLLADNPDRVLSKSLEYDSYLSNDTKKSLLSPDTNKSLYAGASKSVSVLDTIATVDNKTGSQASHSYVKLVDPNGKSDNGIRHRGNLKKPLDKRVAGLSSNMSLTRSVENVAGLMTGSMLTLASLGEEIQPEYVAPVQEEEKRAEGTIQVKYYLKYFYEGGGVLGLIVLVLANLLAQTAFIMSDWWLSYWATKEEELTQFELDRSAALLNVSSNGNYTADNVTAPEIDRSFYIYIYTGITLSVFIFGLIRALLVFKILIEAGRVLHNKMFAAIVRCPVLFFDTNPVGRILNRFSKDMGLMDENLPLTFFDFIQCGLMILGYILVAGIVNPWVFIPTAPLVVVFIIVRKYYLATSRDVKRLEGTTRSPVYSHLSMSLLGLHTIRAYQVQDIFVSEYHKHQDTHTESWFLFLATSRWFAVRLDWLCALFVTSVALCSVAAAESLNGGLVGLTMTYAMALMGLFQWGVRQSAEVENQMTSVERIFEYTELPPEASLESANEPGAKWPSHGVITAERVCFRYSIGAPLVLKNLTFAIQGKEKVGICGRTGAGKSSLIAMLFRLSEPEGVIRVDGLDIKELGLHDLRKVISIIPQDPVLFNGSVRKNLDPFNQHSDEDLWNALAEVQLKPAIDDMTGGLDGEITERGSNLSVGQRQLLCLARAVLKQNKILVIDEATANVDPRTDALIQETIREKFAQCTVLTIAHRLHTIMDSDRVMVLHEGEIVEFDEPYLLLQNEEFFFSKMVKQTGAWEAEHLAEIAKKTFETKHGEGVDLTEYLNVGKSSNGAISKSD